MSIITFAVSGSKVKFLIRFPVPLINSWRRRLVVTACEVCRERRVKCDGATENWPCSTCRRLKLQCVPPGAQGGDNDYDHYRASMEQYLVGQENNPSIHLPQSSYQDSVTVHQWASYSESLYTQQNMQYETVSVLNQHQDFSPSQSNLQNCQTSSQTEQHNMEPQNTLQQPQVSSTNLPISPPLSAGGLETKMDYFTILPLVRMANGQQASQQAMNIPTAETRAWNPAKRFG